MEEKHPEPQSVNVSIAVALQSSCTLAYVCYHPRPAGDADF